ncbi:hypothetical protein NADFUDRAFT_42878 [Nadsonia fulvescens var. elongata DSM 6958]|uniref:Peroxisome assembly protein 22 n=1 Tax=Nadsonia fulvescens var. elongata DSM 6958 TaxID=857566 RepID=A0A1E3PI78_9ASCO|nr:hypothetical protein NADFUDRAFT_42878 [Nadsonia fulvescens var. elongata DSM 6958]
MAVVKGRKFGWVAPMIIATGSIVGYLIYKRFICTEVETNSDLANGQQNKKVSKSSNKHINENKMIAITVSLNLLLSGIPLMLLLSRYPNIVVVLTKEVSIDNTPLASQIPRGMEHKIIPCETTIGIIHILKHLKPQYVVLAADTASYVERDIKGFVGQITSLTGDMETDNQILG